MKCFSLPRHSSEYLEPLQITISGRDGEFYSDVDCNAHAYFSGFLNCGVNYSQSDADFWGGTGKLYGSYQFPY